MLTAELLYTFCSATAYLLQRHCKAVAVLLQIYVQCYCKPFAAPLQKACSVFAVGSVCVSVINFCYLREVSEQPVRDSSANMFQQSGRNSHFCFDGLIYICIAHGIGHVVRLMGKEAESCLSIIVCRKLVNAFPCRSYKSVSRKLSNIARLHPFARDWRT